MKTIAILTGFLIIGANAFAYSSVEVKISGAQAKQLFMAILTASESGNALYPEVEGAGGSQIASGPGLQCKVSSEELVKFGSFSKIPVSDFDCYYGDSF